MKRSKIVYFFYCSVLSSRFSQQPLSGIFSPGHFQITLQFINAQWGSGNLAPNSILMVLVDLDVHQIVGYHYFDLHQPFRGNSVKFPF